MVPPLEEREAALFSGYTPKEWGELPRYERIICVAHFRIHHLIQLHTDDAVSSDLERRQRQNRSRQGGDVE